MRRAWIEISPAGCWRDARRVALLAESVDRNSKGGLLASVSSVALLAESVDRNMYRMNCNLADDRRSPCGERG